MDLLPTGSWDAHLHLPPDAASSTDACNAGTLVKCRPAYNFVLTQPIPDKSYGQIMSTLPGIQSMEREARASIMLEPSDFNTTRLRTFAAQGVRSVRVHIAKISMDHGAELENVEKVLKEHALALAEAELKWPIDAQLSLSTWAKLAPTIEKLHDRHGTTFIADHIFCAGPDAAESEELATCLGLVEKGLVFVKVSGMAKYAPEGPDRFKAIVERVLRCKSGQMALWGSDWPHANIEGKTSEVDEERQLEMLKGVCDGLGEGYWEKLTRDNAAKIYA